MSNQTISQRGFVSWGARAAMASPFVALFGVAVGASIYTDDVSEVAGSGRFTVATVSALAALVLLGLGLVGLYLRQQHALGRFGNGAFALALVGTMLAAGGAWDQVFTVPYLANEAPTVLDAETSGSLLAGFFLSFSLLALGWALFAVVSRRAGVLPRGASTVLSWAPFWRSCRHRPRCGSWCSRSGPPSSQGGSRNRRPDRAIPRSACRALNR